MRPTGKYVFFDHHARDRLFLSYSYQTTKKEAGTHETSSEWKQEDSLRSEILKTQKTNRELNNELKNPASDSKPGKQIGRSGEKIV